MALVDVRKVYVVQDRESGAFVDLDMGFVSSLRHAARAESEDIVRESMDFALYDGQLSCPSGYEVHSFYERESDHH